MRRMTNVNDDSDYCCCCCRCDYCLRLLVVRRVACHFVDRLCHATHHDHQQVDDCDCDCGDD